jgi:hypothetical protein
MQGPPGKPGTKCVPHGLQDNGAVEPAPVIVRHLWRQWREKCGCWPAIFLQSQTPELRDGSLLYLIERRRGTDSE